MFVTSRAWVPLLLVGIFIYHLRWFVVFYLNIEDLWVIYWSRRICPNEQNFIISRSGLIVGGRSSLQILGAAPCFLAICVFVAFLEIDISSYFVGSANWPLSFLDIISLKKTCAVDIHLLQYAIDSYFLFVTVGCILFQSWIAQFRPSTWSSDLLFSKSLRRLSLMIIHLPASVLIYPFVGSIVLRVSSIFWSLKCSQIKLRHVVVSYACEWLW